MHVKSHQWVHSLFALSFHLVVLFWPIILLSSAQKLSLLCYVKIIFSKMLTVLLEQISVLLTVFRVSGCFIDLAYFCEVWNLEIKTIYVLSIKCRNDMH